MPDHQPITGRPIDHQSLAETLERSITELPGVIRLEPTLTSTLTHVRAVSLKGLERLTGPREEPASTGRDGIHLRIEGGLAHLKIELATDISHSCLQTAKTAQQAAIETIERAGLRVGTVNVSILSIETRPAVKGEQPP